VQPIQHPFYHPESKPLSLQSLLIGLPDLLHATAGVFMTAGLLFGLPKLRGSTLVAACLWAILSAVAITLGEGVAGLETTPTLWRSTLRFATACTSFCPMMAVLGAKRPQDGPWQWIVLSLWIVLVLPAAQMVLLPAGPRLELFAAWKIFIGGLLLLELLNWLPTKYWLACCLFVAGQLSLLWESLAGTSFWWSQMGIWLMLAAVVSVWMASSRLRVACHPKETPANDRPFISADVEQGSLSQANGRWLDFRDQYGSFWGLRILQRVNQTAEIYQWPVRLQWWGFEAQAAEIDATVTLAQRAEINRTLDTLLRRFF